MTANGKVLTVSYGAFSCRLIGFADPWAALRALPALGRLSEFDGQGENGAAALQLWAAEAFGPDVRVKREGLLITLEAPEERSEKALGAKEAARPASATLHALPPPGARPPLRPGPALAQRLAALRAGEAPPLAARPSPTRIAAPAPPPPPPPPSPPALAAPPPFPPITPEPKEQPPAPAATTTPATTRAAPGEAMVARLVAQADTALAGPERRARFAALSLVRAAFAAMLGGGRAAKTVAEEEASGPYRQTLARLLGRGNAAAALPEKPAPLVLTAKARRRRGSKRRAKRKAAALSLAVAPRPAAPPWAAPQARGALALKPAELAPDWAEVGEADDALLFDPADFARFAAKLAVADAEAWVEAAGSYAMLIDCHPGFSPAGLLRQLAALPPGQGGAAPPGAEAALAAFHRLVASGKIERRRYGHYVMTADSAIYRRAFAG